MVRGGKRDERLLGCCLLATGAADAFEPTSLGLGNVAWLQLSMIPHISHIFFGCFGKFFYRFGNWGRT